MKIPYPIVSTKNPFFYLTVNGFDFASVTPVGDTRVQVYRVWASTSDKDPPLVSDSLNMPPDYISPYNIPPYYSGPADSTAIDMVVYDPVEQRKNKFTFVFDDQLFDQNGGRYRADFYYLGVYVAHSYFVYAKKETVMTGSTYV